MSVKTEELISGWRLIKKWPECSYSIALLLCNHLNIMRAKNNKYWLQLIYQYPEVFASNEIMYVCHSGKIKISLEQMREIVHHLDPAAKVGMNIQKAIEKIYTFRVVKNTPYEKNYKQNVHNRLIERSIRRSLYNLVQLYRSALNENLIANVAEMNAFQATLREDNFIEHKAKLALNLCLHYLHDTTIHSDSVMTISQCLSLIWQAMKDEKRLLPGVTCKGASESFVKSLYQIQRSYNIKDEDKDNKAGEDLRSCDSGIANILIAGQNGIHSSIDIVFMSLETAGEKVKWLTLKAVKDYLMTAKEKNPDIFPGLLATLKDKGVEVIFKDIKSKIAIELFAEFQPLFMVKDAEFNAIVSTANDVDIDKLLENFNNISIAKDGMFGKVDDMKGKASSITIKEVKYEIN